MTLSAPGIGVARANAPTFSFFNIRDDNTPPPLPKSKKTQSTKTKKKVKSPKITLSDSSKPDRRPSQVKSSTLSEISFDKADSVVYNDSDDSFHGNADLHHANHDNLLFPELNQNIPRSRTLDEISNTMPADEYDGNTSDSQNQANLLDFMDDITSPSQRSPYFDDFTDSILDTTSPLHDENTLLSIDDRDSVQPASFTPHRLSNHPDSPFSTPSRMSVQALRDALGQTTPGMHFSDDAAQHPQRPFATDFFTFAPSPTAKPGPDNGQNPALTRSVHQPPPASDDFFTFVPTPPPSPITKSTPSHNARTTFTTQHASFGTPTDTAAHHAVPDRLGAHPTTPRQSTSANSNLRFGASPHTTIPSSPLTTPSLHSTPVTQSHALNTPAHEKPTPSSIVEPPPLTIANHASPNPQPQHSSNPDSLVSLGDKPLDTVPIVNKPEIIENGLLPSNGNETTAHSLAEPIPVRILHDNQPPSSNTTPNRSGLDRLHSQQATPRQDQSVEPRPHFGESSQKHPPTQPPADVNGKKSTPTTEPGADIFSPPHASLQDQPTLDEFAFFNADDAKPASSASTGSNTPRNVSTPRDLFTLSTDIADMSKNPPDSTNASQFSTHDDNTASNVPTSSPDDSRIDNLSHAPGTPSNERIQSVIFAAPHDQDLSQSKPSPATAIVADNEAPDNHQPDSAVRHSFGNNTQAIQPSYNADIIPDSTQNDPRAVDTLRPPNAPPDSYVPPVFDEATVSSAHSVFAGSPMEIHQDATGSQTVPEHTPDSDEVGLLTPSGFSPPILPEASIDVEPAATATIEPQFDLGSIDHKSDPWIDSFEIPPSSNHSGTLDQPVIAIPDDSIDDLKLEVQSPFVMTPPPFDSNASDLDATPSKDSELNLSEKPVSSDDTPSDGPNEIQLDFEHQPDRSDSFDVQAFATLRSASTCPELNYQKTTDAPPSKDLFADMVLLDDLQLPDEAHDEKSNDAHDFATTSHPSTIPEPNDHVESLEESQSTDLISQSQPFNDVVPTADSGQLPNPVKDTDSTQSLLGAGSSFVPNWASFDTPVPPPHSDESMITIDVEEEDVNSDTALASFEPMGLVTQPVDEVTYKDAHDSFDPPSVIEPTAPEALFENVVFESQSVENELHDTTQPLEVISQEAESSVPASEPDPENEQAFAKAVLLVIADKTNGDIDSVLSRAPPLSTQHANVIEESLEQYIRPPAHRINQQVEPQRPRADIAYAKTIFQAYCMDLQ